VTLAGGSASRCPDCHSIGIRPARSVGCVIDLSANLAAPTEPDSFAAALGILIAKYPAFRFFHAPIGRRSARWIAERIKGSDPGLHTVITDDLGELMDALAQDRGRHGLR
jgi:hypothetical protein